MRSSARAPRALVACALALTFSLAHAAAFAQAIHVPPYVQDVRPTSAWILWETTSGEESRVEWGPAEALGASATGSSVPTEGDARVHEVELTGLSPATRYYYRVHTGGAESAIAYFSTPSLPSAEASLRFVFMSDMQRDPANPDVYRHIIEDGVERFVAGDGDLDQAISLVVVPGDLVDRGLEYVRWEDEFFRPGASLMRHVPFYPTLGNHESNSPFYYAYFHLPEEGTSAENRERWWRLDRGNVRVIGLDSNFYIALGPQEAFLDEALDDACTNDDIDFVFVVMHHANVSELWPLGEAPFANQVAARMERFQRDCGRVTAQFFGHTHAYARGASRDAAHLWVNVATAGGNIDYWGEYRNQYDSEDVSVSQDEWGFVVVDVTAGDDPSLHLRRVSLGNEHLARDNEVRDEIFVRRFDTPPTTPTPLMPRGRVTAACSMMRASPFADPDGDEHGATQWQIAERCDEFDHPLADRVRWYENWYRDVDTQAGDDLTDEPVTLDGEDALVEGAYLCWRARYRDRGLGWSDWTTPVAFQISREGASPADGCDDPTVLTPPPRVDAAVDPDAGVLDGGPRDAETIDGALDTGGAAGGGCACALTSSAERRPLSLGVALLVLLTLTRRRSRRA